MIRAAPRCQPQAVSSSLSFSPKLACPFSLPLLTSAAVGVLSCEANRWATCALPLRVRLLQADRRPRQGRAALGLSTQVSFGRTAR